MGVGIKLRSMEANSVKIKSGIVEVTFVGDQTRESVLKVAEASARALDQLAAQGQPQKSLIDMRRIGRVPADARAGGSEAMKSVRDAKAVIVGAPLLIKHITKFIIKASGKKARLEFFDNIASAEAWLNDRSTD